MKRIVWLVAAVVAVWFLGKLSHPAVDIGKLEPVEAVRLVRTQGGIILETDSGATGRGGTLKAAVADLRRGIGAEVFLETADKLILVGNMDGYWGGILTEFRPTCQICYGNMDMDLKEAARYLEIHPAKQTIGGIRGGSKGIPLLNMNDGRGELVGGQ